MNEHQELQFIDYKERCYIDVCQNLTLQGSKVKILLRPFNRFAADFVRKVYQSEERKRKIVFYALREECDVLLPDDVLPLPDNLEVNVILMFSIDGEILTSMLMDYLEDTKVFIVAPITENYFKKKPLFLISIPKSGTHLLYELVQSFSYKAGVVCPDEPLPGFWYCVEYSNSHTAARDFFIDRVRRSPFGMRDHPFMRSPALFIYRNPLDILVSEANYYHKDGKTPFAGYLSKYPFKERLLKLVDDPWLLGSIRDRIGKFIAWLDFPNVIPVSFEELIGRNGGGDIGAQTKLIWSLQLKLKIPGKPGEFGGKIFSKESATFNEGQIGMHMRHFTTSAYNKFYSLPQDFMESLGFSSKDKDENIKISRRSDEFRLRPFVYSKVNFDNTPITVVPNYLDYNIVKYKGFYYGVSHRLGPRDLSKLKAEDLDMFYCEQDIDSVKQRILLSTSMFKRTRRFIRRFLKNTQAGESLRK